MIPTTEQIVTERCRLRYPSEEDIPHIWSASRVEGFNDGMRWDPPERVEELETALVNSRAAWAAGTGFSWTIEDRESGEFLGRISIRREEADDEWSIGFFTHPTQQRKGYAHEAARAVVAWGFERLSAAVISADHATWNTASQHVLEGLGMTRVGVNPQGFQKRGEWVEEYEYEIRAEDRQG